MLKIFTFLNVLLYLSNAQLYFFGAGFTTFKPLYWYLFTLVIGLILLVVRTGTRLTSTHSLRLIVWAGLFMTIASASFIFISVADDNAVQVYIRLLEAMVMLIMFSLFFKDERIAQAATYAVIAVVIFAVLINYADFFNVFGERIKFSHVVGRAAGLYVDSNFSSHILTMGMVLSVFVLPKKLRWWYCLFVATGVLLTFSRGGLILWTIAIIGLAWSNIFVLPRSASLTVIAALVVIFSVGLAAGNLIGVFKSAGLDSYLNSNTTDRIGKSFFEQKDYSSTTRLQVAEQGLSMTLDRPLFGWGVGATTNASTTIAPHNMYLVMGIEYGMVGVLMLCGLIWLLWTSGNERSWIIAILYAVAGFFTQNNLEQIPVMLIIALAMAGIGWSKNSKKTNELGSI